SERLFEVIEGWEVLIDQGFVTEGPHMFCRLQLRRGGRQENEMEPLGHHQFRTGVVASLSEHQDQALGRPCSPCTRELLERDAPRGGVDARSKLPRIAAGDRRHEAEPIEPLEAVLYPRDGALPLAGPHRAQERFEPHPMLIARPYLYMGGGMGRLHGRHLL